MIETIIKLHFEEKMSLTQISREKGICRNRISKELKNRGLTPINYQNKTKLNKYIFDKIDSEEKAYWLGFIFADGCVNGTIFEITLANKDKDHLLKLKKFLNWEGEVKEKPKVKASRIAFRNKYFTDRLKGLGVVERKSLSLTFPDYLNETFIRHFIRGYFDGDGCIHVRKDVKKHPILINVLGTPKFLNSLREYCPVKVNKLYPNKGSYKTLVFQKVGSKAEKFLQWLYRDSIIYLTRKYKLYDNINTASKKSP